MENTVYLDNSSTTKPCKEAIEAVNNALVNDWGNPSSLHFLGFNAERHLKKAREVLAGALGCREDEIYFNSCGTEGDNTAIIGAAQARKRRGNRIVTTSVEHPAVLETFKRLADEGFETVYIKPDEDGHISEKQIFDAIDEKTILVSIMLVNNEIGSIFPVSAAARAIKEKNAPALLHTDAVQAFGKLPIDVKNSGVDILTLSGHKIHAVKGIGAMYIKKGVTLKPLLTGGGQEKGFRSGTESVPLISALSAATEALPPLEAQLKKQKELWDYAVKKLTENGLCAVNSPADALPYILNVSVLGFKSETLLHFLEERNIFVSSGSACAKGKGSYVLDEMGLERARIDSALRISFSRFSAKEDIDRLTEALTEATKTLRRAYK